MAFAGELQKWAREVPDRLMRKSQYFILATACSAFFLDMTNLSAITIALPAIQQDLKVRTGDLQWVLSGYALTFGAFLLVGGRAGDLYSHRSVMLAGMAVFALSALVCAVVPNFVGLIVARAFQGIGAALTVPSAQAHIPIYFTEPKARSKALGFWGATGSVGFIVGLIIGGALTNSLGWRWILWLSFVFSGILQIFAILTLPHRGTEGGSHERAPELNDKAEQSLFQRVKRILVIFDIAGVCLIVPALLLITYALSSANASGWSSPEILSTLIVSIVLMIAFGIYEAQIEEGLVPTHLFRDLNFNLVLIGAVILYAIRQASTYFLTLQLQSYGNSPLQTSVLFLPMGIASLALTFIVARLLPVLGARLMLAAGWMLLILGLTFFSFNSPTRSFWTSTFIAELISPAGLGSIALSTNYVVITMAPKEHQGAAAGILNVALQVGGSVIGLSGLTAVAQAIGSDFSPSTPEGQIPGVAYESVYYSCMILGFIALLISAFAIRLPAQLRGRIFFKPSQDGAGSTNPADGNVSQESILTDLEGEGHLMLLLEPRRSLYTKQPKLVHHLLDQMQETRPSPLKLSGVEWPVWLFGDRRTTEPLLSQIPQLRGRVRSMRRATGGDGPERAQWVYSPRSVA